MKVPAVVVVLVALTGCGSADVDVLDGKQVGRMAEAYLEREHPRLAPGELTCPDLDYEIGASVRCTRETELGEGRILRVGGVVEVTSTSDGGRVHVELDDRPTSFALSGAYVARGIAAQYRRRYGAAPDSLTCPDLPGRTGATITCTLVAEGVKHDVDVTATAVDDERWDTDFTFRSDSLALARGRGTGKGSGKG